MRIALVIEDVGMGGGQERVIAELLPRLARRHDVHLFCFSARDVDLTGVTVHQLFAPRLSLGPRAIWFAIASSLRVRRGVFDIVLSQGGNTLVQNAALVHTMHREKHRARRSFDRLYERRAGHRRAWEGLRDAIFTRLERRAALRCRGSIIAISRTVKDYLVQEYGLCPEEVHVAANGVDHRTFSPELREEARSRIRPELGIAPEDFVALFMAGRWFEKGLSELINGLAMVNEPVTLVVVGSGDIEHFSGLAADRGLERRIRFVPHVDRPQDYFAMADCLVHPDHLEPFGLVMLEAAACGLPLVVAKSGVALDLISEGVTGFFIEREPDSIAASLERIASSRDMLPEMGRRVHERSLEFSWERQADTIEQFLAQFCSPGSAEVQ